MDISNISTKPTASDVLLWPDDEWCFRDELSGFTHKSDDYEVLMCGTERWHEVTGTSRLELALALEYGYMAFEVGGTRRPLEILESGAGFYIGTSNDGMPYTRESVQYWRTRDKAEKAKTAGLWTQRSNL